MSRQAKPLIGISACLLGEKVRYDGGHKRDTFIVETLSKYCNFLPLCPETAIGMSTPRPPIRLIGAYQRPQAVGVKDTSLNVTQQLEAYAYDQVSRLPNICGYILKKDSPSCGMERVKVYPRPDSAAERKGSGIFARILMERSPLLPVEEEGRLNDPVLRENFINRLYVLHRWQQLCAKTITPAALIDFHARHKYLVMAHSQAAYKRLGQQLTDFSKQEIEMIADAYILELMTTLKRRVDHKRHVNVLQHIMGYLKRSIDTHDKAELLDSIESYRQGQIPLIVPITLLKHYFRRHPDPYIEQQVYLQPHPEALGLRNTL
ncbi:MAG: DUF523 and DUF1722 domain-containing protein [Chromatiales bacterium]|nr:DUF523 and DUF1722 domain-containing protein [Chromatiales bacterium]